MVCCLNPDCPQPVNADDSRVCVACGTPLIPVLRHRYRIVKPLGRGGFGATYLAEDSDRRNAPCVVKQFSPSASLRSYPAALEKATELFNQEAERLLQLEGHLQIPRLFAYFEEQGRLYLVQEFIQGQTLLAELKQNGAYSDRQIEALLQDLLPVLQFIHAHQVIHRDIKPENIIRRQQDGKPVLIDFGVARLITGTILTGGATTTGTPGYAPPEQMQQGKVYPASDLYSLGATCLHLLTGIYPHDLYDAYSGEWVWRDRLAESGRSVSDRLGQVLDRFAQPLVKDRYSSASEALQALNSGAAPTATSPLPPTVASGTAPTVVTVPPTVVTNGATQTQSQSTSQPDSSGGIHQPTDAISSTSDPSSKPFAARLPNQKIVAIAIGAVLGLAFIGGALSLLPRSPVVINADTDTPTDASPKATAIANIQSIIGTRADGWVPIVLKDVPLQDDLLPAEVEQLMPGGGNISEFGFSEILVSDIPGLWKYRFSFPEDDSGQRRLFSLSLYFDPALRGLLTFEEFAELLAQKYGDLEPGEVEDGIVIWSGPDSATATLTDGINDFDAFELNITFP